MSGSMTGGVDSSIPLRAGQGMAAAPNPLAQIGEFAKTVNELNRLKLFPGIQELQKQEIEQQQQTTGAIKTARAWGFMAPLLAVPPDQWTHQMVTDEIARAGAAGADTQPIVAALSAAPSGDGAALHGFMWSRIASQMQTGAEARLGAIGPNVSIQNTGQELIPVSQANKFGPTPGAITQQPGSVAVVPSTSDLSTPVEYTGADGSVVQTTKGEYASRRGISPESLGPVVAGQRMPALNAPLQSGGGRGGQGGGGGAPPGYTGRYPAPAPSQGGGLSTTSGPAPGQVRAAESAGGASGDQYAGDRRMASSFATRVLPLRKAVDLLNDTETGPKSDTFNWYRSMMISLKAQGVPVPEWATPDKIDQAKFDELKKYMANYISGIPFAGGSDARMAEAISGSPNIQNSTLANKDLAKVLVGMERYKAAQVLAFDQAAQKGEFGAAGKNDPNLVANRYAQFATKFNQNNDPRAFAYDLMDKSARAKMLASMKKEEREKFQSSLRTAYGVGGLMQ